MQLSLVVGILLDLIMQSYAIGSYKSKYVGLHEEKFHFFYTNIR